ncbi:MAG: SDR family oxidoreductase [Chloroflexota bacterium]|nr:SDR family oxidoreductase [Chloroflexota bacterium]
MRLENRVAVVTGAASGFGRASAHLFAREGAKVVVADINDVTGEETVAMIKQDGGKAIFVHTDITRAADVERLVKTAIEKFGKIDILFNNAGIGQKRTEIENTDEAMIDQVYALNVKSIFLTARYVVPLMKKAGGGVIINTASTVVHRPGKNICVYASSKGAVDALTRAMALELAPSHIRVNSINPGLADTPLVHKMYSREFARDMVGITPLGRLITPEDVAYAALYLASDESAMTTGSSINVDGGRMI